MTNENPNDTELAKLLRYNGITIPAEMEKTVFSAMRNLKRLVRVLAEKEVR